MIRQKYGDHDWWNRPWFLVALVLGTALPLLWPETPPLVDFPGHVSRYRVQLDLSESETLQRYFDFHWALIGNLGADLLIIPLSKLFGLEASGKLIAIAIPPLTAVGIIGISKETHGELAPASLFSIPFIYSFPFNFGFLNFSLSLAFAFNAYWYWLYLTNRSEFKKRYLIFVPVSCILWVTHVFGWGVFGLLALSGELARLLGKGAKWPDSIGKAFIAVLPLTPPIILMLIWRSGEVEGETKQFFDINYKLFATLATLRDQWRVWDVCSIIAVIVLLFFATVDKRLSYSSKLSLPAGAVVVVFMIMPRWVFGSNYADMRLSPLIFILLILAIAPIPRNFRYNSALAWLGLSFVVLRLAGNLASFALADREAQQLMTALRHVPRGAAVLTLVGKPCKNEWSLPRASHFGSFVIIRKEGFSNDQYQSAGAHLLQVKYNAARNFTDHNSVFVFPAECAAARARDSTIDGSASAATAVATFPREAFDFVWMIDPYDWDMRARPGLTPIWRRENSVLYRVDFSQP